MVISIFHMEKSKVNSRPLICQSRMCHKVRIRVKTPCLPAHCTISTAGGFHKSTGNWTPKINEVHKSHCLEKRTPVLAWLIVSGQI